MMLLLKLCVKNRVACVPDVEAMTYVVPVNLQNNARCSRPRLLLMAVPLVGHTLGRMLAVIRLLVAWHGQGPQAEVIS
jgi:hypothetical protein